MTHRSFETSGPGPLILLANLIASHEDWLVHRLRRYAKTQGYTQYTSTIKEAWRKSIAELSGALLSALKTQSRSPELRADEDYTKDPIAAFGILEARRHRARGITLDMFMGLMKYYRQSFVDLVQESGLPSEKLTAYRYFIDRFFDRVELGMCAEWRTLSENRRIEELQSKSREITNEKNKYMTIFESLHTPVILIDKDNRICNLNNACAKMFGVPVAPGGIYYNDASAAHPLPKPLKDLLALDREVESEICVEKQLDPPNGPRHFQVKYKKMLDFSDKFTGTVVILNDITDRVQAEQQLKQHSDHLEAIVSERASELVETNAVLRQEIEERRQAEKENFELQKQLLHSQKMEAIGTLAGGIAHDFNNILSAILGYSELAKFQTPEENKIHDHLKEVITACYRAKELVLQILTFSRHGEQKLRPVQIHIIVKEVLKLLRSTIPTTIRIRQNIDENCGVALADPTQIHQVILNLCANAYHAMREKGGTLAISLKAMDIDREKASINPGIVPGEYLRLTVSDTGHGMDQSVLQRIFEPYFTTKTQGEGTGLGLSVIHGIVKSHNGFITAFSEPGQGATFHVYLPNAAPDDNTCEAANSNKTPRGTEHILIVDDEEVLVRMLRQHLEFLGYRVTAYTDSPKALQAFRNRPTTYDLVITDMNMPNLTGRQLSQELLAIRPELPIILCTGFSETITEKDAIAMGIKAFILKPVLRKELAETIRKVLLKTPIPGTGAGQYMDRFKKREAGYPFFH